MPRRPEAPPDHETLDACRRCPLWRNATQGVPGDGPRRAVVMLVGEQPGNEEDLQGKPFVGPAGHVLDNALAEAGLDRQAVFLTNAVKHFKFELRGKRRLHKTPGQLEMEACAPWLEREVRAVNPKVIVALGVTAAKAVLGETHVTLSALMEAPCERDGRVVLATYHPSFVLRQRSEAARKAAFDRLVASLRRAAGLVAG